MVAVTVLL